VRRDSYDVIVVGGRVAGATTAALLGDAGARVLLVERIAFPAPRRGMDMASIHATFLADAVVDWLGGGTTEDDALGRYRQLRDDHALDIFEETVEHARDLSRLGVEGAQP